MTNHLQPPSPGKKVRAFFISALLVSLTAGAFVLPVIASAEPPEYSQDTGAGFPGGNLIIDPPTPISRPPCELLPWPFPQLPVCPIISGR